MSGLCANCGHTCHREGNDVLLKPDAIGIPQRCRFYSCVEDETLIECKKTDYLFSRQSWRTGKTILKHNDYNYEIDYETCRTYEFTRIEKIPFQYTVSVPTRMTGIRYDRNFGKFEEVRYDVPGPMVNQTITRYYDKEISGTRTKWYYVAHKLDSLCQCSKCKCDDCKFMTTHDVRKLFSSNYQDRVAKLKDQYKCDLCGHIHFSEYDKVYPTHVIEEARRILVSIGWNENECSWCEPNTKHDGLAKCLCKENISLVTLPLWKFLWRTSKREQYISERRGCRFFRVLSYSQIHVKS